MEFEIVHTFEANRDAVERAMLDPELAAFLLARMSLVRRIELLEQLEDGVYLRRRVRYVPQPTIPSIGGLEVKPEWMAWTEESSFDRRGHRLEYRNVPTVERVAEVMEQRGSVCFEDAGPGCTKRVISGSLRIKMPMVGRLVEKVILPNARKILDEEASALATFLAQRRS